MSGYDEYMAQLNARQEEIKAGKLVVETKAKVKRTLAVEESGQQVDMDQELPPFGRLWRIESRSWRKTGQPANGWSARYGGRHNREFMDVAGDELESKRKAIMWLWQQHKDFGGNPGSFVKTTRWPRERVVDCARVTMQRVEALFNSTPEELKKECELCGIEGVENPLKELIEQSIMVAFEIE